MKNVNKRIAIGFQIAAAPFVFTALFEGILSRFGYHLYLFGQVGRPVLLFSEVIFIAIEAIMLLVLSCTTRKLRFFLFDLLLAPFFLLTLLSGLLNLQQSSHVDTIAPFDEELVITNRAVLFLGDSRVYQKAIPFVVEEVAEVGGDDGWCPLSDKNMYRWEVSGNELILTYDFYGYGENEEMRFRYENGHFIKIYDSLYDSFNGSSRAATPTGLA